MENTFLPFEFEAFNIARINNVLEYIMFWGFDLKHQFRELIRMHGSVRIRDLSV